jgi:hypothetical protein
MLAKKVLVAGAAALVFISDGALAQTHAMPFARQPNGGSAPAPLNFRQSQPAQLIAQRYLSALKELRTEALHLRAEDGGVLTPAHYNRIQTRLDAINADFQRQWRNNDPYSVDGRGNPL